MEKQWKMVPVVPTDDMIVAFAEAWYSKRQCIDDPDMLDAYRDMLAAAPAPPACGVQYVGYPPVPDDHKLPPAGGEVDGLIISLKDHKIGQTALLEHIESIKADRIRLTSERDALKERVYKLDGRVREEQTYVSELAKEIEKLNKKITGHEEVCKEIEYDLIAERDALKADVERLQNLDHRQILAESAAAYLLNSGAENFIGDVFTIEADDGTTKFEVIVTTQKVGAKSPGEVCNELQSELTKAREFLQEAVNMISEARALLPKEGGSRRHSAWREGFAPFLQKIGLAPVKERGTDCGLEQSPNTCMHPESSCVWWESFGIVRTGRECHQCGHVEEDAHQTAPAAKGGSDE